MSVQAVSTTGIYCRPGCSARPNPENVSAFQSPVAAEAAGYRSCLRCRPDRLQSPGGPSDAPAPVATAMSLISDGYLDRHDEAALAARVGYSPRQLRRLFELHLGASPTFVARSRRAHFARRLLDETDLAMPTVARAAGFGSSRQMNRVVHDIFGFGPTELRSKRRRSDVMVADGGLRLRLPFVEPLDRDAALDHLTPRLTPAVEARRGSIYRRTIAICGNPGIVEVDLGGDQPHLELLAHLPTFDSLVDDVGRIRSMFGLDDDIAPAVETLSADPVLGGLVRARPGVRVIGGWDRFETTLRIVLGQQVSVLGASTTAGRLAVTHGTPLGAPVVLESGNPGTDSGLSRVFPTADQVAGLDPAAMGIPRARAKAVTGLAAAVASGAVDLHATDPDELRAQLTALKGIGPWTADLTCLRVLRDPDAFAAGDLGLRRAYAVLAGNPRTATPRELREAAEAWRPNRALAAQHLWTSLSRRKDPA